MLLNLKYYAIIKKINICKNLAYTRWRYIIVKKKLLWAIIPIALIVGIIITYFQIQYPSMTFEELLGTEEYNITKVLVINPVTGARVETENKEKIMELINLFNNRTYRKNFKQRLGVGYIYAYDFYSGDNRILSIVDSGRTKLNIYRLKNTSAYYTVSNEISVNLTDSWVDSIVSKNK